MHRWFQLQPNFRFEVDGELTRVKSAIRSAAGSRIWDGPVEAAGDCVDLKIASDEQRFWSPHLSIQMHDPDATDRDEWNVGIASANERVDARTELVCRFSPRPEVWTLFMAIYAIIIGIAFMAIIYAYVQWSLGHSPWAVMFFPLGLVAIGGMHAASLVGQNLSRDQMTQLRSRLDQLITTAGVRFRPLE